MSLATGLVAYTAVGFITMAWLAYRNTVALRRAFWLSTLWPLAIIFFPALRQWMRMESNGWLRGITHRPALYVPRGRGARRHTQRTWVTTCPWWTRQVVTQTVKNRK